eukprot:scaffold1883_cov261-Pinguiococcus_pyrenoidosus.AAC.20
MLMVRCDLRTAGAKNVDLAGALVDHAEVREKCSSKKVATGEREEWDQGDEYINRALTMVQSIDETPAAPDEDVPNQSDRVAKLEEKKMEILKRYSAILDGGWMRSLLQLSSPLSSLLFLSSSPSPSFLLCVSASPMKVLGVPQGHPQRPTEGRSTACCGSDGRRQELASVRRDSDSCLLFPTECRKRTTEASW